jgi:predicted membrane chloride channel (bestrophin family)
MSYIIESAKVHETRRWQMHNHLTVFHDILGGCERLLRMPIPVSSTIIAIRIMID